MELTPRAEAENLIYKLRQRQDLLLRAGGDDWEEYDWCQTQIVRLEKATGATSGIKRSEDAKSNRD